MTLDDLRALEAAATPGPWHASNGVRGWVHLTQGNGSINDLGVATFFGEDDTALTAAARNALPALLAIAEASREVAELHRMGAGGDSWWEAIERLCEAAEAARRLLGIDGGE